MSNVTPGTIRVMLVDGHRSVMSGLERLIEAEQPRMQVVAKATSCAAALALAAETRPDVVVLDPDLDDGEDGTGIIPELVAGRRTRVLLFTGLRDAALHEAAVLRGASGVVRKQEPAETLLKAIERVHGGELWLGRGSTARVLSRLRANGAAGEDAGRRQLTALTAREREIVEHLARDPGGDNRDLARRLSIGEHTLRNHLSRIYAKLGVPNRFELYLYAQRHVVNRQPGA